MRAADVEATLRARLQWAAGRPLELDPHRSWAVFKELLEEPISDAGMEDDLASFQCGQRQWDDGAVGPCVYFTRQFSIWDEPTQTYVTARASPGEWILGYAIGFQYPSHLEHELGTLMYWTEDFGSRQEFIAAVESAAQFQSALRCRPEKSGLTIDAP